MTTDCAPVLAEVTRGGIVESQHRGIVAVARADGSLLAWVGDTARVVLPRSALKPFQAIPLMESGAPERFGYGDAELASACGSHSGEERHREVVGGMLARAGVPEVAMRNGNTGPYDEAQHERWVRGELPRTALYQNCSGKHAGMLAACVARGYLLEGYDELAHPQQQDVLRAVAAFFQTAPDELAVGIDGCTLPTHGAPLRNIAAGWAALADPEHAPGPHRAAARRLVEAMAAEPQMVAGTGQLDTVISQITGGRIVVKGGAEAVLCCALRDRGLGVTFKIDDGSDRPQDVVALALLRQLDALRPDEDAALAAHVDSVVRSNREQVVGEIRAVFELTFT
jgi:L-asparaginase II